MQVDTDPDGVFEGEVGEEIIPLQSPPKGAFSSIRHISPNTADFQDFVQNLRCNPGIDLGLIKKDDKDKRGSMDSNFDDSTMAVNNDVEIARLKNLIKNLEENNLKLMAELQELNKRKMALERALKEARALETQLTGQLDTLADDFEETQSKLTRIQEVRESLEKQLEDLRHKYRELCDKLADFKDEGGASMPHINFGPTEAPEEEIVTYKTQLSLFELENTGAGGLFPLKLPKSPAARSGGTKYLAPLPAKSPGGRGSPANRGLPSPASSKSQPNLSPTKMGR